MMGVPFRREPASEAAERLGLKRGDRIGSDSWAQDREVVSCGPWGIATRTLVDRAVATLKSVPTDLRVVEGSS